MADIEVPRRIANVPARRRSQAAPGAVDIPTARIVRDPGVRVVPGAFGGQIGRAVEDLGGSVVGAGARMARISERNAAVKRRGMVDTATAKASIELRDWARGRENDPDYETYPERYEAESETVFERHSEGLDEEGLAEFKRRFEIRSLEYAADVRGIANGRLADETVANLDESLDGFAHLAGAAKTPSEYDLNLAQGLDAIDEAVADGVITEVNGGVRKRRFLGATDEVAALQDVMEDPGNAIKLLEDKDNYPHLDEKRRLSILSAAQADVAREQARREAIAGQQVTDAVFVLNRGRVPDNLGSVQAAAKGTRYEPALNAAIANRQAVQDFTALPLDEQGRQLREMDRRGTTTRSTLERQDALIKAYSNLATLVNQGNGLAAAAQAGAILDPLPLNFRDASTLSARAAQADVASQWAGQPISPLLDSEADALGAAVDQASPGEVSDLLRSLHDGFGSEQAGVVTSQIAPKRPELAVALSVVPDDPITSRDIILGARLMRETPDVKPQKDDRISAVENVYGNLFTADSAGALNAYMEAGTALYAARRIPGGDLTFDGDVFEQALRDVSGGPVEINGRMILPPVPGMEEDAVEDLLESLTDEDLTGFGNGSPIFMDGAPFTVDLFDRPIFHNDAQLITSGPGRYLIFIEGLGYVQSSRGGAYELNLGAKLR